METRRALLFLVLGLVAGGAAFSALLASRAEAAAWPVRSYVSEYVKGQNIQDFGGSSLPSGLASCSSSGASCLSFTATAAAGQNAFVQETDAKHCLNGSTCTRWLEWDGTNSRYMFVASPVEALALVTTVSAGSNSINMVTGSRLSLGTSTAADDLLSDGTRPKIGNSPEYFMARALIGSGTIDFGSIALGVCAESTVTVTNAAAGNVTNIGVPVAAMVTGSIFQGYVSSANTVTIRHCCVGNATCDPGSGTFTASVEQ